MDQSNVNINIHLEAINIHLLRAIIGAAFRLKGNSPTNSIFLAEEYINELLKPGYQAQSAPAETAGETSDDGQPKPDEGTNVQ